MVKAVHLKIKDMIEDGIDRVKLNKDNVPVILVGGGSILVSGNLKGASDVLIPEHSDVANAIGPYAAIMSVYLNDGKLDSRVDMNEYGYGILAMGGVVISIGL